MADTDQLVRRLLATVRSQGIDPSSVSDDLVREQYDLRITLRIEPSGAFEYSVTLPTGHMPRLPGLRLPMRGVVRRDGSDLTFTEGSETWKGVVTETGLVVDWKGDLRFVRQP